MMPAIEDTTEYRHITSDFVETMNLDGREILKIDPEGISQLTAEGIRTRRICCDQHTLHNSHKYWMTRKLRKMIASSQWIYLKKC